MIPDRTACAAFTLGEVMVALLLSVLAILSATLFFGSISRAAKFTENVTTGSEVAQAKLVEILQRKIVRHPPGRNRNIVQSLTQETQNRRRQSPAKFLRSYAVTACHHRSPPET